MKVVLLVILISLGVCQTEITSASEWFTCGQQGQRVCQDLDSGELSCCQQGEFGPDWGGEKAQWTDQIAQGPGNQYLLCEKVNECTDTRFYAKEDEMSEVKFENLIPDQAWILRLYNTEPDSEKLVLSSLSINGLSVELFSQKDNTTSGYIHRESFTSDSQFRELEITSEINNPLIAVVLPSNAENSLEFLFTSAEPPRDTTVFKIVIISSFIFNMAVTVLWVVYFIRRCKKKRPEQPELQRYVVPNYAEDIEDPVVDSVTPQPQQTPDIPNTNENPNPVLVNSDAPTQPSLLNQLREKRKRDQEHGQPLLGKTEEQS